MPSAPFVYGELDPRRGATGMTPQNAGGTLLHSLPCLSTLGPGKVVSKACPHPTGPERLKPGPLSWTWLL